MVSVIVWIACCGREKIVVRLRFVNSWKDSRRAGKEGSTTVESICESD